MAHVHGFGAVPIFVKKYRMEKQDAARLMYMEGAQQKEIARLLRLSENTVSRWKQTGDWEGRRVHFHVLKDNSAQRVMKLIDYQIRALEQRTEAWKEEAKETGETPRLIERGDIDALQKLYTTIKSEQKTWSNYVGVMKQFLDWLSNHDIELAQKVTDQADVFLNEKRKML